MPELPDLTLYAVNLRKQVLRRPILTARVYQAAKVNVPEATFQQALSGHEMVSIGRQGKELYFTLSGGEYFSVHLMLNGRFSLAPITDIGKIPGKVISIEFTDGGAFVVADVQGLCRVQLHPPKPDAPDALSEEFSWPYFTAGIKKSARSNIKALLLNQHFVRGIGNAYADEILYRADISPKSIAGSIPEDALEALYAAIRWVFEDAIEQLTRLTPDAIAGEERSFLRVHNRRLRQTAEGQPILCEDVAKKRTYFTPDQKLYL